MEKWEERKHMKKEGKIRKGGKEGKKVGKRERKSGNTSKKIHKT